MSSLHRNSAVALTCLVGLVPCLCRADLKYTVSPDVEQKKFKVTIKLDKVDDKVEFRIPAWCPGFYTLLRYQDKISEFVAMDDQGAALTVKHADPRGWVVANPAKSDVTITYKVKADDPGLGFFGDSIRKMDGYISGPATFMYPPDRLKDKAFLTLELPKDWAIATALEKDKDTGEYKAANYDELVDSPVQVGKFETRDFAVGGIPFTVVFVGDGGPFQADLTEFSSRLATVSEPAMSLFGGASFKKYIYFLHLTGQGFQGGLEHRASTVIAIPDVPHLQIDSLAAHEFFHAWNVKQIRPKVLGPFDYSKECRTGNLWFAEGVTDYYAALSVYRAGLTNENGLLSTIGDEVRQLQGGSSKNSVTLEQCSLQEWDNGGLGFVGDLSYYTKGSLVGLILDAEIRADSHGTKSLDDVMRAMYAKYRLPEAGYEEDGILKAVNAAAGKDLSKLYRAMVQDTGELPYGVLRKIGLRVVAPGEPYRVPGYTTDASGIVLTVSPENDKDGLMVGDRIVQVYKKRFDLTYQTPGFDVPEFGVDVLRNDYPVKLNLRYVFTSTDRFELVLDPMATQREIGLRNQWLKRATVDQAGGSGSWPRNSSSAYVVYSPQNRLCGNSTHIAVGG